MFEVEIEKCCKKMKLSKNLADLAQTTTGGSHQEFLFKLLTSELEYRQLLRKEKLISSAGFYSKKTLEGYVTDEITFPQGGSLGELLQFEFVAKKENIVMYGGPGTGKTHLSIALGMMACRAGIPVRFYRTAALVNQLSEAKKAGNLTAIMKKVEKADIIILDEWGYIPFDRTGARLLFEIISECYERKSIILNTNLEFSRWVNILYDEQMTAAILDRLLHHCHLLLFPGTSIRLRQSSLNDLYRIKEGGAQI